MKKIASPLFQDLSEAELDTLAAAGHLRTRQFAKHEVIFRAGSCVREIGIVLRGSVHIENLDLWGTKSILSSVGAGQAFAETYAFCGEALMVDAVAAEHCEILFLHTAAFTDARIEPRCRTSCCAACWRCPCARTSAFRSASSAQRPRLCADGC